MPLPDTIFVTYIHATPEKVWQALTSAEFTKQFFFGRAIESDWRPGSPWKLVMDDGRTDSEGRVVEADPPRKLVITWRVVWMEEMRSLPEGTVEYLIEPLGEVVKLTMTERHGEGLDPKYLKGGQEGWPMILNGLKTLLETGRRLPIPMPK